MVFLSHCKTTKTSLVMPFAQALESIHMPYWFDRKDIVCGGPIYTDIKTGIQQSIYCMAFIDATYLERDWTKRELTLFRHKELTDNRSVILPIYCGISKEDVYHYFPWLEGRAFERLTSPNMLPPDEKNMLLCRLIEKIFADLGAGTDISLVAKLLPANLICQPVLEILKNIYCKNYFTSPDIRLSCIELCNIENLLFDIMENTDVPMIEINNIAHHYAAHVKNILWDTNAAISYDYAISLRRIINRMANTIKKNDAKMP